MLNQKVKLFDKMLLIALIVSVIMPFVGAVSNVVVVKLNDGMPVRIDGMEKHGKRGHHSMIADTKLPYLADIFIIDFPTLALPENTPISYWAEGVYYPSEGGVNAISIGDIFIWIGTALTVLLLPVLLIRLVFLLLLRRT